MRIGFIGAGKVATAFGRYLHSHGIVVSGYHGRHTEKVAHACRATDSRSFQTDAEVAEYSDILLLTTRDDQIADACGALCRQGAVRPHHLIGHMSGAHASTILADAQHCGAGTFSLHPLQAFADEEKSLSALPKTYFSLEGTDERLKALEQLLQQTGNPYFRIAPEHKRLYHLAACMLSNYLVTLMDCGLTALKKTGIDPGHGFQAMLPLIQGTIENIAEIGPSKALTGPIARGDATTIEQHINALDEHRLLDLKEIYLFLGEKTLALATRELLADPSKVSAVKEILEKKQ